MNGVNQINTDAPHLVFGAHFHGFRNGHLLDRSFGQCTLCHLLQRFIREIFMSGLHVFQNSEIPHIRLILTTRHGADKNKFWIGVREGVHFLEVIVKAFIATGLEKNCAMLANCERAFEALFLHLKTVKTQFF